MAPTYKYLGLCILALVYSTYAQPNNCKKCVDVKTGNTDLQGKFPDLAPVYDTNCGAGTAANTETCDGAGNVCAHVIVRGLMNIAGGATNIPATAVVRGCLAATVNTDCGTGYGTDEAAITTFVDGVLTGSGVTLATIFKNFGCDCTTENCITGTEGYTLGNLCYTCAGARSGDSDFNTAVSDLGIHHADCANDPSGAGSQSCLTGEFCGQATALTSSDGGGETGVQASIATRGCASVSQGNDCDAATATTIENFMTEILGTGFDVKSATEQKGCNCAAAADNCNSQAFIYPGGVSCKKCALLKTTNIALRTAADALPSTKADCAAADSADKETCSFLDVCARVAVNAGTVDHSGTSDIPVEVVARGCASATVSTDCTNAYGAADEAKDFVNAVLNSAAIQLKAVTTNTGCDCATADCNAPALTFVSTYCYKCIHAEVNTVNEAIGGATAACKSGVTEAAAETCAANHKCANARFTAKFAKSGPLNTATESLVFVRGCAASEGVTACPSGNLPPGDADKTKTFADAVIGDSGVDITDMEDQVMCNCDGDDCNSGTLELRKECYRCAYAEVPDVNDAFGTALQNKAICRTAPNDDMEVTCDSPADGCSQAILNATYAKGSDLTATASKAYFRGCGAKENECPLKDDQAAKAETLATSVLGPDFTISGNNKAGSQCGCDSENNCNNINMNPESPENGAPGLKPFAVGLLISCLLSLLF